MNLGHVCQGVGDVGSPSLKGQSDLPLEVPPHHPTSLAEG
jgi:hypothetical protein